MTYKMKKVFFVISIVTLCVSCGQEETKKVEEKKGDVVSAVAADNGSEESRKSELARIEKEKQDGIENSTSMSFDKMVFDFGTVEEDTENKASFTVTNTGKNPLIISEVNVSCGCTTAKKPEKPIEAGQSDKIEVVFHPKVGQLKEQDKSITVTANTNAEPAILKIKAYVIEKKKGKTGK